MKSFWLVLLAGIAVFSPRSAPAQQVDIGINVESAERLLALACSNQPIDAVEFANSPVLRTQLNHHRDFGEQYTLDTYLAGLRAAARCETPDPDPFRFSSLVERREAMRIAIGYLADRQQAMADRVAAMIAPYLPPDMRFRGEAVLAAASFSCGGFAGDGRFYIDVPCIAADVDEEYDAVVRLIAHETYHAAQHEFAAHHMAAFRDVSTLTEALDHMFASLAIEGTASHVADMRQVEGDGSYSRFARGLARRNFGHLPYNFRLFDYMIEALVREPDAVAERFPGIYGLAFDGAFSELGYFAGQQMAAEIEHSFGAAAIPCVIALPPENYVLAYDRAIADAADDLDRSTPFAQATIEAARRLAGGRGEPADLDRCLEPVRTG